VTAPRIAVLAGDGIGPQVLEAALPAFEVLGTPVDLVRGEIGWECWKKDGNPVPPPTWSLLDRSDAALLGAVTSKPDREARADLPPSRRGVDSPYVSPVVQLRQRLDLFANERPVTDFRGDRFDFVVVRENTEGLYAGFDQYPATNTAWSIVNKHRNTLVSGRDGTAISIRVQTRTATMRLMKHAFGLASARRGLVTVADKPNVLRQSANLVREVLEEIQPLFPNVRAEVLNVDAVGMWMVTKPQRFDVIVAENMFGDILSDVGAGVMGGLGLASSGNIGEGFSYFEPVHGSAPRLAGTNRANPMAMFLSIAALLKHLESPDDARRVRNAVRHVLRSGETLTYDLGGSATTLEVAAMVLDAIEGSYE